MFSCVFIPVRNYNNNNIRKQGCQVKTFKNSAAYNNKVKEMRRVHGFGVPTINFFIKDYLHSIFIPPTGVMTYLISNKREEVDCFPVKEVILSERKYLGTLKAAIKTPIPNLWIVLEFDSFGGQICYLAQTDWIEEFKRLNPYTTDMEQITPVIHETALKLSE